MKTSWKCLIGSCNDCPKQGCGCVHHAENELYWSKAKVEDERENTRKFKTWANTLEADGCHPWIMSVDLWHEYNDFGQAL